MKKNDIAAIVLIVALSGVLSYFVADAIIGTPENDPVQIERVTPIGSTFPAPDTRTFSSNAIDPTVEIEDGGQSAEQPFSNE